MLNQHRTDLNSRLQFPRSAPGRTGRAKSGNKMDMDLVRRTRLGERGTFDLLVLKYQQRITKLILRYMHDPKDAEDVAQDTFIRAYLGLRRFRGDCAFYTWLYRIAINSATNALSKRAHGLQTISLEISDSEEAPNTPSPLRDANTPEDLALTEEVRVIVGAAVEALPVEFKAAVVLRELNGMSYADIAALMNTPVGTVRSRIYRAREFIDLRLRDVCEGGLSRRGSRHQM
jgi:RNA polymerase sigma-70 factor, ECF subfamily